ncbi:MAG: ankyrin repeat domain-containing protein [Fimbriimonas sp.]
MAEDLSRRAFCKWTGGITLASATTFAFAQEAPNPTGPVEAVFVRDYPSPEFKPSWKKPQINREMVQDFVIYAHSDLEMTRKMLDKEPMLINGFMDWGAGDWESGLGGASHMGRRDIVEFLLERGARIDIFTAAMMGQLEAVKAFLTLQPKLIDSRGPHGFTLHFHGQLAGKDADKMVEYLQSVKKIGLKPNPFVKKPPPA